MYISSLAVVNRWCLWPRMLLKEDVWVAGWEGSSVIETKHMQFHLSPVFSQWYIFDGPEVLIVAWRSIYLSWIGCIYCLFGVFFFLFFHLAVIVKLNIPILKQSALKNYFVGDSLSASQTRFATLKHYSELELVPSCLLSSWIFFIYHASWNILRVTWRIKHLSKTWTSQILQL